MWGRWETKSQKGKCLPFALAKDTLFHGFEGRRREEGMLSASRIRVRLVEDPEAVETERYSAAGSSSG